MAIALTGCGGSGGTSDTSTKAPPASGTSETPRAAPTGTFTVTGTTSLDGKLSEIVCVPSDEGIQVTAEFSAGDSGSLTVVSGSAPAGSERRDSLTVKGGGTKIYSRISADSLPFDVVADGSKVTGSVVLADIQDVVKPDVEDRKQVKLSVDVDCGT